MTFGNAAKKQKIQDNSKLHADMPRTKAEIEAKFGVHVYVRWSLVPFDFHPRGWYKERGIIIPQITKPDAIKGGGGFKTRYSFLFKEENFLNKY